MSIYETGLRRELVHAHANDLDEALRADPWDGSPGRCDRRQDRAFAMSHGRSTGNAPNRPAHFIY